MGSCVLFYGPGARQATLNEAYLTGRMMAPPFGDDGLKVEAAREVVTHLMSTPVGTDLGVVVVGPMDQAGEKASDVLLKVVEEFDAKYVQPFLWAIDVGGVSPTIRSRCLERWAPSLVEEEDEVLMAAAWDVIDAVAQNDSGRMVTAVRPHLKRGHELLQALAEGLCTDLGDPTKRALWMRVREASRHDRVFPLDIMAALAGN